MCRTVLIGLIAVVVLAQTPGASPGWIEGTVVSDRTGLPLPWAHIVLRPAETGLSAIGVDTDDKGFFAIGEIERGPYSLNASRDGYLASSLCKMDAVTLPQTFTIHTKESVTDIKFRLHPFAVLTGRVAFDDGEPATNVRVEEYREYQNHLRHGYLLVGSASKLQRSGGILYVRPRALVVRGGR